MRSKSRRRARERAGSPESNTHWMLKWKGHLALDPRWQELGPIEYQRQIAMDHETGVGVITYPVMRAIEKTFPEASKEKCFTLANHIIHEVLHPIEEYPGVWKLYPLRNADLYYGGKKVIDAREEGDHSHDE